MRIRTRVKIRILDYIRVHAGLACGRVVEMATRGCFN